MTRTEFNEFWLPKVNDVARRLRQPPLYADDLDGLWFNYLTQQDEDLQRRAEAAARNTQSQ